MDNWFSWTNGFSAAVVAVVFYFLSRKLKASVVQTKSFTDRRYRSLLWRYLYNLRREMARRVLSPEEYLQCEEAALSIENDVATMPAAAFKAEVDSSGLDAQPDDLAAYMGLEELDCLGDAEFFSERTLQQNRQTYLGLVRKLTILSRQNVEASGVGRVRSGTNIKAARYFVRSIEDDELKRLGIEAMKRIDDMDNSSDVLHSIREGVNYEDEDFVVRWVEMGPGRYGLTLKKLGKHLLVDPGSYGEYGESWSRTDPSFSTSDALRNTRRMSKVYWRDCRPVQ